MRILNFLSRVLARLARFADEFRIPAPLIALTALHHAAVFPRSLRNYLAVNEGKHADEPLESLFFVHLDTSSWCTMLFLTRVLRGRRPYTVERMAMRDYFKPGVRRLGFGRVASE